MGALLPLGAFRFGIGHVVLNAAHLLAAERIGGRDADVMGMVVGVAELEHTGTTIVTPCYPSVIERFIGDVLMEGIQKITLSSREGRVIVQ